MQKLFATLVCLILCAVTATGGGGKAGKDELKIEGAWKVTAMWKNGKKDASDWEKDGGMVLTFKDGKYTVSAGGKEIGPAQFYKIDAKMKPAHLDFWVELDGKKGKIIPGLVKVEGDVMTIVNSGPGKERPKDFDDAKGVDVTTVKRGK
jgi:uncharacterized protein (TIGR03067 family)